MIDSHCHLADEAFDADLEAVVARAIAAGVARALCVVTAGDAGETARLSRVARAWPAVAFALGVHPHAAGRYRDRLDEVSATVHRELVATRAACAIGEVGLDYHYDFSPREVQRDVFARQIALARELGWPVVVHTREADEDTLAILRAEGRGEIRGVFHCFTGEVGLASAAVDLGFHVSFSGIVTFPKAEGIRRALRAVPDDRLLIETDAPYLAPVPHRGRRNEPAWVVEVLSAVAAARGVAAVDLAQQIDANFVSLFGLSRPEA